MVVHAEKTVITAAAEVMFVLLVSVMEAILAMVVVFEVVIMVIKGEEQGKKVKQRGEN